MVTLSSNSHLLWDHKSTDDAVFVQNTTVHRNRRIASTQAHHFAVVRTIIASICSFLVIIVINVKKQSL